MIQNHAPYRLAKLEFKRVEIELKRELKRAEDELRAEDLETAEVFAPNELLDRHESVFGDNDGLISRCETLMSEMRARMHELIGGGGLPETPRSKQQHSTNETTDRNHLQETCASLETWLESVRERVARVAARLRMLPQTCAFVESTLGHVDAWLTEISRHSLGLFDSHLASAVEYKRTIDRLEVSFFFFFFLLQT